MLRILLADDHGIVRAGLRVLIESHEGMHVVAEADDGVAAVEAALRHDPDVAAQTTALERRLHQGHLAAAGVVVAHGQQHLAEHGDHELVEVRDRQGAVHGAREIRSRRPRTAVVLLSMHDDERYLFDALRAGASGYVLKRAADEELIEAVRAVAAGKSHLPASTQGALVREWLDRGEEVPRDPLTPREQDVVKLIAEAYTNKQIAEILQVSEKTVESHRGNVLAKLGMRDRVELVRYAIRRGLIEA